MGSLDSWQLALIALLQGLTEFLPISSSAHLILFAEWMGWPDQGLAFDTAVHFGTLLALCWYLRRELSHLTGVFAADTLRARASRHLWLLLLVGTLPLALVGFFTRSLVEESLRHVAVIAAANLLFAALLWRAWQKRQVADAGPEESANLGAISWRQALAVGSLQVFALIPGASRSGVTMTAGFLLGLPAATAIRFSFLLAVPALLAAFVSELLRWQEVARVSLGASLMGVCISALMAFLVLRTFTALVGRVGMLPFVVYRLLLGAILLIAFVRPATAI